MKYLKLKKLEIKVPEYDPNPEKSKTNNHNWRVGLFIILTDYDGREYIYMPKWKDISLINQGKDTVEHINKELLKTKNAKKSMSKVP